jgi:hypothetical protein
MLQNKDLYKSNSAAHDDQHRLVSDISVSMGLNLTTAELKGEMQ